MVKEKWQPHVSHAQIRFHFANDFILLKILRIVITKILRKTDSTFTYLDNLYICLHRLRYIYCQMHLMFRNYLWNYNWFCTFLLLFRHFAHFARDITGISISFGARFSLLKKVPELSILLIRYKTDLAVACLHCSCCMIISIYHYRPQWKVMFSEEACVSGVYLQREDLPPREGLPLEGNYLGGGAGLPPGGGIYPLRSTDI